MSRRVLGLCARDRGHLLMYEMLNRSLFEFRDGAIALIPCVTYKYYQPCQHCKDERTCGIRSIIKDIRDETVNLLKKVSLIDIILREEKLKHSGQVGDKNNYLLTFCLIRK